MKDRKIYAVISVSHLSAQDRAYAQRMGIIREPKWRVSGQNASDNVNSAGLDKNDRLNLGDPGVLPAADIKSGWGMNVESKTGKVRRMR